MASQRSRATLWKLSPASAAKLEVIDISYCPNVSDATLAKIAEHCSKLKELRVRGTAVSSVGVAEVRSKFSKLKIVS
jgi:hypothetical protein